MGSYPPITAQDRLQVHDIDLAHRLCPLLCVCAAGVGRRLEASLPVHHKDMTCRLWLNPAAASHLSTTAGRLWSTVV